ncbi:cobalamin binding intrinsic factor-like [Genypterus blacodes]|uniref:cobalamin binding intrinsic factor-like n=1 Tax=Genypterus blacodes TaxID=154954 RepID=UPI003F761A07
MVTPAFLSVALLLLLPAIPAQNNDLYPIDVVVVNRIDGTPDATYRTDVVYRGILLGAMRRLMQSDSDFKFTYTENLDYGPYLESVNGVAGNAEDHTYWALLVKKENGTVTWSNVGIGCYIPQANDQITLNFTKW